MLYFFIICDVLFIIIYILNDTSNLCRTFLKKIVFLYLNHNTVQIKISNLFKPKPGYKIIVVLSCLDFLYGLRN